jgi:hypothetical protein
MQSMAIVQTNDSKSLCGNLGENDCFTNQQQQHFFDAKSMLLFAMKRF